MRSRKVRITITVDRELLRVAKAAVRAGRADSLSGWINQALTREAVEERRRAAAWAAIADYEAEFGQITAEDMERQYRIDRARATRVRPRKARRTG